MTKPLIWLFYKVRNYGKDSRMKMDNPNQLLDDLVKALDSTYWSSWQTTAKFDKQLDAAREYVEKLKG